MAVGIYISGLEHTSENETVEKYAARYEINMLRCIFCGACEEACPKDAIYLTISKELVPANYNREDFIFGKDKLVMPLEMAVKNTQLNNVN